MRDRVGQILLIAGLCVHWFSFAHCQTAVAQQATSRNASLQQAQTDNATSRIVIPDKNCPSLAELGYRFKQMTDISLDVGIREERLPPDCSTDMFSTADEDLILARSQCAEGTFCWVPNGLYHQPLYFEDAILERYGQSYHPLLQPWISGAHFFSTFPVMPYKIGLDRTHDKVYSLGYYRPGSSTPCIGRRLPLELDAATFETGAWLGLIFLLP